MRLGWRRYRQLDHEQVRGVMTEQPAPIPNDGPSVWQLVLRDMYQREQLGIQRYGVPLQPLNGRDSLQDAYEEALDLVVYLRQVIEERRLVAQNLHLNRP